MDIHALPVHPDADIFPMLDEDDLRQLAEDIKANGLNHPIVVGEVDGEMMLIDGRNRREACRLAGVDPATTKLNGHDPKALILSENIHRRHMSKGQQAMAVAMMFPEGHWKKKVPNFGSFKGEVVTQARYINRTQPEMAKNVLSGVTPLYKAHEEAKRISAEQESEPARLDRLKASDPDFAQQVIDGEITLVMAEAGSNERRQREVEQRAAIIGIFSKAESVGQLLATDSNCEQILGVLKDHANEVEARLEGGVEKAWSTVQMLEEGVARLKAMVQEMKS